LTVELVREDGVAVLTINRPEAMNALDLATLTELRDRIVDLRANDDVQVIVLTGAGDRAFAAGADIKYMSRLTVDEAKEWGHLGQHVGQLLEIAPKVSIAAINGFALGGGCELALACDIRYAATTAKLGQPEVNLGIIPGWGGTQRLARVCGLGVAKDLILTGRAVDADEALRIRLVSAVFEPRELLEKTMESAWVIAAKGPLALAAAKAATNHALQGDHVENLQSEAARFGELFESADAKEGMAAFVEKREPRFSGG
jgi:enoyl-CoA hydratase